MSWLWFVVVMLWLIWAFVLTMAQKKTIEAIKLTREMLNHWMRLQEEINREFVRALMADVNDLPPTPPTSN